MEKQLIHSSVTCLECGEVLVSYHRHDYKTCSCEQGTMIDGGLEYLRCGGKDLAKVQTNTLYDDAPHEQIREVVSRGGRGVNGDEPLTYVLLKDISSDWLESIIEYETQHRPTNRFLPIYKNEQKFRQLWQH
jgi:hypothetical protein